MLPVLQATQARLDALEADNDAGDALAADSDDEEVVIETDDEGGRGQGWQLRAGKAREGLCGCEARGFRARCGMCSWEVVRTGRQASCLRLHSPAAAMPHHSSDLAPTCIQISIIYVAAPDTCTPVFFPHIHKA